MSNSQTCPNILHRNKMNYITIHKKRNNFVIYYWPVGVGWFCGYFSGFRLMIGTSFPSLFYIMLHKTICQYWTFNFLKIVDVWTGIYEIFHPFVVWVVASLWWYCIGTKWIISPVEFRVHCEDKRIYDLQLIKLAHDVFSLRLIQELIVDVCWVGSYLPPRCSPCQVIRIFIC